MKKNKGTAMKQSKGRMARLIRQLVIRTSMVTALLLYLTIGVAPTASAASATLSLTPATASVTQGSDIQLTIRINAGANQITGAQACITFDSAKLTLTQTDISSSAFSYTTPGSSSDCSAGQTQVSRFDITQPSGTLTLAVLTFRANQGGATANVSFDNTTSYIKDNDSTDGSGNYISILTGSTGTSVTLNAIPAAPASPAPATPPPAKAKTTTPKATTPAIVNNTPPAVTETAPAQTSSSDVTAEAAPTPTTTPKITKKAASNKVAYIVAGIVLAVLIAAGLVAKFVGIPGVPLFAKKRMMSGSSLVSPPQDPELPAVDLSNVPGGQIPPPSSVVQPNVPPEQTNNPYNNNQRPPGGF